MKYFFKVIILLLSLTQITSVAHAEPTSGPVSITQIRPFQGGLASDLSKSRGLIYIEIDSSSFCNTNTFSIDLKYAGSQEMYSAAMAAMMAGKKVKLDLKQDQKGCHWGKEIRSIYVVR